MASIAEAAIGLVATIGEALPEERETPLLRRACELTPGRPHERSVGREGIAGHGRDERRQAGILVGRVVKRPMRLERGHEQPLVAGDRDESRYLLPQRGLEGVIGKVHTVSTETPPVGIRRVCPHAAAMGARALKREPHRAFVAGVATARNVQNVRRGRELLAFVLKFACVNVQEHAASLPEARRARAMR